MEKNKIKYLCYPNTKYTECFSTVLHWPSVRLETLYFLYLLEDLFLIELFCEYSTPRFSS